jgi:hypothetical protein
VRFAHAGRIRETATVSALPLIEAVQRAGGALALRDDKLRLSAARPLPESLLQELRAHKAEVIDHLQHARGSEREGHAPLTERAEAGSGDTPTAWTDGVPRLRTASAPRNYPRHAWQQLVQDAEGFLDRWGTQAAALGWPGWELFGCHRRAPWGRIDGMGLVLLLNGDPLAALTATEAVIRRASGAHQTRRRKPRDPLTAAERCMVWELADG